MERKRTVNQVLDTAGTELAEKLEQELPADAEIENRELNHSLTEQGTVRVQLVYSCRENIAVEVPIQAPEVAPETEIRSAERVDLSF